MSLPLLVETIEDHFVPVLVYNNKKEDEAILASFKEPSWNNPVVRFLDSDGNDLIPRRDGVWDVVPLAERMKEALSAAKQDVPVSLQYVADGWQGNYRRASFAML